MLFFFYLPKAHKIIIFKTLTFLEKMMGNKKIRSTKEVKYC